VFNIEQSAPGDSGITSLHPNRHPSSATFSDLGGRTVVDYDGITLTTLPDGAVVSLEERSDGNPLGLDGAARLALIDGLQRVDPEQWWIAGQPGRDGLCREGADG
jgi:hypothetical protein